MASGNGLREGSRWRAILRLRCPRCLSGRVFRTMLSMHERCPECGYRFGREEGYFTGAMYVSYTISLVLLFAIIGVLWVVWPGDSLDALLVLLLVASLLYVPLVPIVFRYSRVVWMHFDRVVGEEDRED